MPHVGIHRVSVGDPPPLGDTPQEKIIYIPNTELNMYLIVGGMASGKSSVTIVADMPEGIKVGMETSLEILVAAANALAAMDSVGY